MPDRRFWWLRIEALGETGDWAELDRFAKSQKSPIGYEVGQDCGIYIINTLEIRQCSRMCGDLVCPLPLTHWPLGDTPMILN